MPTALALAMRPPASSERDRRPAAEPPHGLHAQRARRASRGWCAAHFAPETGQPADIGRVMTTAGCA